MRSVLFKCPVSVYTIDDSRKIKKTFHLISIFTLPSDRKDGEYKLFRLPEREAYFCQRREAVR